MKSMASLIVGIVVALLTAVPAHARKGGDDSFGGARVEDRGGDDRPRRDFRRQFQDGGTWLEEDPRGRGRGRLTPEERRDLRRDIRDAGRDIYTDPRRRRQE